VTDDANPSVPPPFLGLGERLRQRGLLDAALAVAEAGVARFPHLAAAHDLMGRIRADLGDDEGARSAWLATLECHPDHLGALKGLAFVAFRRHDFGEAEGRLEQAARTAPRDTAVLRGLDRIRLTRPGGAEPTIAIDAPEGGVLLANDEGLRIGGHLGAGDGDDQADAAAALVAGLAREAARTTRLLELGNWRHLVIEGDGNRTALLPMAPEGVLLVRRPLTTPAGRLLTLAARARDAARAWLGSHG